MKVERMDGPRVRLTPVRGDDHAFIYNLAISDENAYRWLLRGALPAFEQFIEQHDREYTTKFTVWEREEGERIGEALIYKMDSRNGHCHVAVVIAPEWLGGGFGREALGVLISHVFAVWPMRKIYAEVPGLTFSGIEADVLGAQVNELFTIEGRLRSHLYIDGAFHDLVITALDRDRWTGLDAFLASWTQTSEARSGTTT
jgi:RimJ/RimL family protein N-acetyltransferase